MARTWGMVTLLLIVSGCASAPKSPDAICDGTVRARYELADALAADGSPNAMAAGRALIAQLDAYCLDV
jgi:major membrane immunogen (membrane-anchored lipoprotein)